MLQSYNTVVNFYRIRLTGGVFLNSLSSNIARTVRAIVFKNSALAVVVASLALSGCAGFAQRPDAEVVKERAQARWDALVKGDVDKAYAYLSPGSRATMTAAQYAGSLNVGFWKKVTVDEVRCSSAQQCDAILTVEYEFRGSRTKTPMKESWIKEGSTWWYVQK
jgi:hypothetical protein